LQIIAGKFGIKPSIPAYRNPNLKPEDLLTGVTFASGGAGYVPFTTQLSVIKLLNLTLSIKQNMITSKL